MLKHLPENALSTFLHIFNNIWATGVFPDSWRLATVIPISKPGKDHAEPTNYRPISLTKKESSKRKEILFCWLTSHVDITGNEAADRKAKDSLKSNMSTYEVPFNNFKPFINTYIMSEWQKSWDTATLNKRHAIKPVIKNNPSAVRNIRREDVVITRLRISHTRFTHSYLLNREEQTFCIVCNQYITVKHILTDCIDFSEDRNRYFQVTDLKQLFQDVSVDNILSFLKDINLLNKL